MINLETALEQIFAAAKPLKTKEMPLKDAANYILAKPVIAKLNQPPFDCSAMDGFAVIASDIKAGVSLQNIGMSQAGSRFNGEVKSGECIRIFTGAPMPKGANAIIMQEPTKEEGENIIFSEGVLPNHHVRKKGQDFFQGQVLLETGTTLNAASIALAAAGNNDRLEVFSKPKIAILATGDELVEPGSNVSPDQIISSNPYGLTAIFDPLCESVNNYPIAPDDEGKLKTELKQILASEADIIVTSGGASVGKYDFVQPTLKSLGIKMDFWKLAIKPGKPLMFGTFGDKLVFGLPGNPVSALVTAIIAVLPAIRAMQGMRNRLGERLVLPLAAPLKANGERRHFLRGIVQIGENGFSEIMPISEIDSANLTSMSKANALIINKENSKSLKIGELVEIIKI